MGDEVPSLVGASADYVPIEKPRPAPKPISHVSSEPSRPPRKLSASNGGVPDAEEVNMMMMAGMGAIVVGITIIGAVFIGLFNLFSYLFGATMATIFSLILAALFTYVYAEASNSIQWPPPS